MGELQYTREQLEGFFAWKMETRLKHFDSEMHAEEVAKAFALNNPKAYGFITFRSEYRGKRFFWIDFGDSQELDAMDCYLRVVGEDYSKRIDPNDPRAHALTRIQKIVLKNRVEMRENNE